MKKREIEFIQGLKTIQHFADWKGVSRQYVHELIGKGKLNAIRIGGHWFITNDKITPKIIAFFADFKGKQQYADENGISRITVHNKLKAGKLKGISIDGVELIILTLLNAP